MNQKKHSLNNVYRHEVSNIVLVKALNRTGMSTCIMQIPSCHNAYCKLITRTEMSSSIIQNETYNVNRRNGVVIRQNTNIIKHNAILTDGMEWS